MEIIAKKDYTKEMNKVIDRAYGLYALREILKGYPRPTAEHISCPSGGATLYKWKGEMPPPVTIHGMLITPVPFNPGVGVWGWTNAGYKYQIVNEAEYDKYVKSLTKGVVIKAESGFTRIRDGEFVTSVWRGWTTVGYVKTSPGMCVTD